MNIKRIHSWLLIICIILGQLTAQTDGSELEWDTSVNVQADRWYFRLFGLSSRDQKSYWVTLYQQLEGGKSVEMYRFRVKDTVKTRKDLSYRFHSADFQGETKIVSAKVMYPDNVVLKTKNFDLNHPEIECLFDGGLEWGDSMEVVNDKWKFNLLDVPSRNSAWYSVTLYQKLEEDQWLKVHKWPTFRNLPEKTNIPFTISGSAFQGDSKIIMAEVMYPDKVILESKIIELKGPDSMIGVILGCVAGGVCLIAVVVGCILWNNRRRRRDSLQQQAPFVGQEQGYETNQAPAMVQEQNSQVQQEEP